MRDNRAPVTVLAIVFWLCVGLLAYAHLGYGLLLLAFVRLRPARSYHFAPPRPGPPPEVSVIVAAYAEAEVIASRIANLRELVYPSERLAILVACDGSPDETPARARAAGADVVLELPRGGKIHAQNAAVREARGEILAFSDANALWEPDALRRLIAAFEDPEVGYACGRLRFIDQRGGNQEGAYWRYETALRALESRAGSITAGNGAIYATRRESYLVVDPVMGHDLSFPFNMVKRGWRAVYVPEARAVEKMVPTIEGEFARKRRMMSHMWAIVLRGGMLSPRGYGPLYALEVLSHRLLRYLTPFLHAAVLVASVGLLGQSPVYLVALILQVAILLAALLAPRLPLRPLLLARYYVLTTLSPALGLWDWLRHGVAAGWEPAEGTR